MELMTLKKAAEYLKMNPEVLRRKVKDGTIPGKKIGERSSWRFYKEELDKFIEWNGEKPSYQEEDLKIFQECIDRFYRSATEEEAIAALQKLGELKQQDAVPFLCEILLNGNSSSAEIVWSMRALIKILGSKADRYLNQFLDHKDKWVQLEANIFFAEFIEDENAIAYLKEYYRETKSFIALKSLIKLHPEDYTKDLETLLSGSTGSQDKILVLRELQKSGFLALEDILRPLFEDKDVRVVQLLIQISGERKIIDFQPELQKIIDSDKPKNVKKAAAKALMDIFTD